MNKKYLLLYVVLGAALSGAALFYLRSLHNEHKSDTKPTSMASAVSPLKPSSGAHERIARRIAPQSETITNSSSAMDAAARVLAGNDPDRWKIAAERYFNLLNAKQLWDLMTSPGIADQNDAKWFRDRMTTWCSGIFLAQENGSYQKPPASDSLIDDFCKNLHAIGDFDYFSAQAKTLSDDASYQNSQNFKYAINPKNVSASERVEINDSLKTVLSGSVDPQQTDSVVNALWELRSDAITDDWNSINNLYSWDRDKLRLAITTSTACAVAGGCGPNNPWTIDYCASQKNICAPGMTLDEAIANNLQPGLLPLYYTVMQHVLVQLQG